jgi:hypothetical protein
MEQPRVVPSEARDLLFLLRSSNSYNSQIHPPFSSFATIPGT